MISPQIITHKIMRDDLEEIQEFITSQKNLLSSLPLCEDIVISADGDNEDVIDFSSTQLTLLDLILLFT